MEIYLRLMCNNLLHGLIALASSWGDCAPTMPQAPARPLLYRKYGAVNLIRGQVTLRRIRTPIPILKHLLS